MTADQTFSTTADNRQLETVVHFNADAPLTLSASNASGSVDISTDTALQAGTLRVAATRTDGGTFEDDDHHLTVKAEGNTVSIHPDWQFASGMSGLARRIRDQLQHGFRPEDWNLSRLKLSPELDFNIVITLPLSLKEGSQMKIRTASGEVSARDITAGVSIATASGDVDARTLTGTVAVHTASGDVEMADVTESLEMNTASGDLSVSGGDAWLAARSASGDVSIRNMQLRNARITTVSGDIQLDSIFNNSGSYGMETVSGDISLSTILPGSDAAATLAFGTLSGSSHVDDAWQHRKRREWHAGEGDNRISINVKTVSGDLSARARLDPSVTTRSLEMPSSRYEDIESSDFRDEMKTFGKEMKAFGKEMKHMTHPDHMNHPTAPIPPVPPTPHVPTPPAPPTPPAGARRSDDSGIFTAGPSGRDYRRDQTPSAQPTEPVSPPERFTDEEHRPASAEQDNVPIELPEPTDIRATTSQSGEASAADTRDERLRVLEALEKGEIDIEDALARLEAAKDQPPT